MILYNTVVKGLKLSSLIILIILSYLVVYIEGARDGIRWYQHSRQFQMTLESAYRYGCFDCGRK